MAKESYLFGYSGKRKTLAEMNKDIHWTGIHPEIRRRALALMNDCPHDLGFGNGFRTYDEQMHAYKYSAGAPPGNSYHEAVDPLGYGLALDFLNHQPAIGWANENASKYGFQHGKDWDRSEPWHFQAIEVPASKRNYRPNLYPLRHWPLPTAAPSYHSPWPTVALKPGDRNTSVAALQRELANWNKGPGAADGIYGTRTRAAVEAGQREVAANGFDPGPFDGIYGTRTRAAFDAYYQARGWGVR